MPATSEASKKASDTLVDVQMPVRKGGFISGDVIERLLGQDVGFTFYVEAGDDLQLSPDGESGLDLIARSSEHLKRMKKSTRIAFKRNKLRLRGESPYVYLADNDILLPERPIFGGMIEAFERRPELGAVGLCYQPNNTHVACGSMMLRRRDLLQIGPFRDTATSCVCGYIGRQLEARGLHVVPVKRYKPTDLRRKYQDGYPDYEITRCCISPDGILSRTFLEDTVRRHGRCFRLFIDA